MASMNNQHNHHSNTTTIQKDDLLSINSDISDFDDDSMDDSSAPSSMQQHIPQVPTQQQLPQQQQLQQQQQPLPPPGTPMNYQPIMDHLQMLNINGNNNNNMRIPALGFATNNNIQNNNIISNNNNINSVAAQTVAANLVKQRDLNMINNQFNNKNFINNNNNQIINRNFQNNLNQDNLDTMSNRMFKMNQNNQVLPIDKRKIVGGRGASGSKMFQIIWKNISYTVKLRQKGTFEMKTRTILNNLSGCFSSSEVAAIMGPSGAGKSTFLEVLACRKQEGLNGWLKVKNIERIRIAYVPQNNYLMEKLTVYETLIYACKLNYSTMPMANYNRVDKLIKQFGLTNIRDTRVARCSGGQQKRVSIALELFSKPNLLILDEPTTGLDSSSCALVVKILKDLVKNPKYPMAILATIHQPSWSVFTEFNNVYIISRRGENLYLGPPQNLIPLLEKINLPCDKYNSPPDYIIEIAAEDYGTKPVKMIQSEFYMPHFDDHDMDNWLSMEEARIIRKTPLIKSITILMSRQALIFQRNLFVLLIRIVAIVMLSAWMSITFGHDIGKSSGCPLSKYQLYSIPLDRLSNLFEEEILNVMQNNCCLFFGLIVGLISGMTSTVLEFPREMHIFMKEYNNGWYSCISFYISKTIMDLPMQIIIPSIYIGYVYYYTGQPRQYYREAYLLLLTVLVSFISECMGATVSAIFMKEPTTAAFVAGAMPMPMILFGGFLVKYSRMPKYMQFASWFSLMKYAFEGLMVAVYGFDRCDYDFQQFASVVNVSAVEKPTWAEFLPLMMSTLNPEGDDEPVNNITLGMDEDDIAIYKLYQTAYQAISDKNSPTVFTFDRSVVFNYYGIEGDWILFRSLIVMGVYLFVIKIVTYFVILNKLKKG